MSWLRKLFIFTILLTIPACGFRPIYEESARMSTGVEDRLAAIKIGDISAEDDERVAQILRTNLEKELNLQAVSTRQLYTLNVSLIKEISALGVKKDKEITRYNLAVNAKYNLREISTGKIVREGRSRIVGGYDAVTSDFGTYAAEKDIEGRIMSEVARDIKVNLSSYFLRKDI